ncbi:Flp family type IVb pilin [Zobellella sp. DQSA1]|uniref:Flp family type IVb pilin n=1 Tax=Zobellella sp. DQSA1 TaxID=3342386 RepID=UPI0035C10AD2
MTQTIIKGYVNLQLKAKQFMEREDGASAIEYGIIAGLIAVAFMVAAGSVGDEINSVFTKVAAKLKGGEGTGGE